MQGRDFAIYQSPSYALLHSIFFFFAISLEVSVVIVALSGKKFKSQKLYGLPKVMSNVKKGS